MSQKYVNRYRYNIYINIIQGSVEHGQGVVKDGRADCPLLDSDWCPATVEGYPSPFGDSSHFGREQAAEGLPEPLAPAASLAV